MLKTMPNLLAIIYKYLMLEHPNFAGS